MGFFEFLLDLIIISMLGAAGITFLAGRAAWRGGKRLLGWMNEQKKLPGTPQDPTREAEDVVVDVRTRSVRRDGKWINLTDKEFDILRYFMEHRGQVVRNQDLYEGVWGEPYVTSAGNSIMVHILNLRKKLERDVRKPEIIKTVWGKGYRID